MNKISLRSLVLITLIVLTPKQVTSQAPSLSVGLDQIVGAKGTIDVELLSEIISEKQDELKKEGIKRMISKGILDESFTTKNFLHSSFSTLLDYQDKKTIKKEILKHASNYALVYAFTETILNLQVKNRQEDFDTLCKSLGVEYDYANKRLPILVYPNSVFTKGNGKELTTMIMDMVLDAMLNDEFIQNAGFIQIHPELRGGYDTQNKFRQLFTQQELLTSKKSSIRVKYGEVKKKDKESNLAQKKLDSVSVAAKAYYERIKDIVQILGEYSRLYKDYQDNNVSINSFLSYKNSSDIASLKVGVRAAIENLADLALCKNDNSSSNSALCYTPEGYELFMKKLKSVVSQSHEFTNRLNTDSAKISIDDYYFVDQQAIPLVIEMCASFSFPSKHIQTMFDLKKYLFSELTKQLDSKIENVELKEVIMESDLIELDEYGLLSIIGAFNELDKENTFESVYKILGRIGENNLNEGAPYYLKNLIYFLETYTSFDTENNRVDIEVEDLIIHFFEMFDKRKYDPVNIYFGIGLSTAIVDVSRAGADGFVYDDFSLASEKLGIKLKVYDFDRNRSLRNTQLKGLNEVYKSQTPFIKDLYLFAYGSGLLYNIANTTTEGATFNSALAGGGLGVSFFNDLDLNFSVMSPVQDFQDVIYYSISFDVKITEYLTRLNQKRKESKANS